MIKYLSLLSLLFILASCGKDNTDDLGRNPYNNTAQLYKSIYAEYNNDEVREANLTFINDGSYIFTIDHRIDKPGFDSLASGGDSYTSIGPMYLLNNEYRNTRTDTIYITFNDTDSLFRIEGNLGKDSIYMIADTLF